MAYGWNKEQYLEEPLQALHDYSKATNHLQWAGDDMTAKSEAESVLVELKDIFPKLPLAAQMFYVDHRPEERTAELENQIVNLLRG